MSKIHPAAWIGLVINIGMAFYGLEAYGDMPVFPIVMFCAAGLSAVGIIMLAMGQPAGGILGAIGAALFVPIGLVCMVGCMRTRQALIKDAKSVDTNLVDAVFGDGNANAAPSVIRDAAGSGTPAALSAQAVSAPVADSYPIINADWIEGGGQNPAASVSGQTAGPATGAGTSNPSVRPASDFRFKDQRALMAVIFGIAIVVFVGMSATMYVDISGPILTFIVVGGISFWTQSRILSMPALALYDDHLTCVSSQAAWAGENTVMYKLIQNASINGNKGYITAHRTDGAGTEDVKILFNAMPSDVREEAKRAFADKMRAVGARFSQS